MFQPGAYGALPPDGHVAVVDVVNGDGSFTISEMHAPMIGRITTRTFDAQSARAMAADPGVTLV